MSEANEYDPCGSCHNIYLHVRVKAPTIGLGHQWTKSNKYIYFFTKHLIYCNILRCA
jgi:hypothetical protein